MDTNEHEEKAVMRAMDGQEFWYETELGKALAKRLPGGCTRIIIDIPVEGLVKIYYATVDSGPVLGLKWDDVIEQFDICKPSGMDDPSPQTKAITNSLHEKCRTGEICHQDIFDACELLEAYDQRIRELYRANGWIPQKTSAAEVTELARRGGVTEKETADADGSNSQ